MASGKRGRPRKPPRPATDLGTPELAARHAAGLTAEPLDICLARGILSVDQHWCGIHLRWLYTLRFGAPVAQAAARADCPLTDPRLADPLWRAAREAEYQEGLQRLGRRFTSPVLSLCVHNEWPHFLRPSREYSRMTASLRLKELEQVREGLDRLRSLWCRKRTFNDKRLGS